MNISLPCMIARSIYNQSADFSEFWLVPVVAVAALVLLFLGGEAVCLLLRRDDFHTALRGNDSVNEGIVKTNRKFCFKKSSFFQITG